MPSQGDLLINSLINKRQRQPKRQSRMDNPDTLTTIMNRERKDDKKDYFDF